MKEILEWYWLFRNKKTGYIDVSRHSRPDFVAMAKSEGHIKLEYDRMLIRFPKGIFDFEASKVQKGERKKVRKSGNN